MESIKKELFEEIKKEYKLIMKGNLYIQIILFIMFFVFKRSSLFLVLFTGVLNLVYFSFMKDFMEEKDKKRIFKVFLSSFVLFILTIINHFAYRFVYLGVLNYQTTAGNTVMNPNGGLIFAGLFDIATILMLLFYTTYPETKEMLDEYYNSSFIEKLGLKYGKKEVKKGSVRLCINEDTNEDIYIPNTDRFLHMLILGPTGCGKTSQTIIPMINQDVQNYECGITVIEPKGDLAEVVYAMAQHYGRECVYFNPVLDACPTFNPLFGREEDVVENMVTTFKMLSPDSKSFFQDQNEILLRNALRVLKRSKGNSATLIDLNRLIWNTGGEGRKMVNNFTKLHPANDDIAKENFDIANYFLNDYFAEAKGSSKTYEHCSGVRTQVAKIVSNKYLRKVLNPENGKSDINFDEHLEKGGLISISTTQGYLRDLGRFLGYFIILNFQSAVFKRPGTADTRKHHFLYIDEFQVYANPGFADMLTQGRSYRVASHLATQNRALIGMGRGQEGKDFVELVSTNARNVVVYPGGNYDDAKFYSNQFGEQIVKRIDRGISRKVFNPMYGMHDMGYPNETIKKVEELKARFTPTDIMYKEFGQITYSIITNNSLQPPGNGKVQFIPRELNDKFNKMVEENNIMMLSGLNPNHCRDLENGANLNDNINIEELKSKIDNKKLKELKEHKTDETAEEQEIKNIVFNNNISTSKTTKNNYDIEEDVKLNDDKKPDEDVIIIDEFEDEIDDVL